MNTIDGSTTLRNKTIRNSKVGFVIPVLVPVAVPRFPTAADDGRTHDRNSAADARPVIIRGPHHQRFHRFRGHGFRRFRDCPEHMVSAATRPFGRHRGRVTGGRRHRPRVQAAQPDDNHEHRVRVNEVDDEERDWRPDARARYPIRGRVG